MERLCSSAYRYGFADHSTEQTETILSIHHGSAGVSASVMMRIIDVKNKN
jgi:hypothetical protein